MNRRFLSKSLLSLLALTVLVTSGCLTAASMAREDRTTGDQTTDAKIAGGIISRLSDKDKGLLLDVNVDVWEQRVMLTGTLDDPKVREEVVELIREDKRITQVNNFMQIVTKAEKEQRRQQAKENKEDSKSGVGQSVNDFWIAKKIEAKLIGASGIKSVNYRWRSVLNTVYIIGRSKDSAELKQVLEICRGTDGVKDVKHVIQIKPLPQ